jgi:hypothetical protein
MCDTVYVMGLVYQVVKGVDKFCGAGTLPNSAGSKKYDAQPY